MNDSNIVKIVEDSDESQLASILKAVAERVRIYRSQNKGLVSLEMFPYTLSIGGGYGAVEIIVEVEDGESISYALKFRSSEDQGWQDCYHIPGSTIRFGDNDISQPIIRVLTEIYGKEHAEEEFHRNPNFKTNPMLPAMVFFAHENERLASYISVPFILRVKKSEMAKFVGTWKCFDLNQHNDPTIVSYHQKVLERLLMAR